MLEALKFVRGAVAKRDYLPALTHFRISGGRVTGYNGVIALSSPIDLDIEASPRAVPFVKAIERCTVTTAIHVTPAGKLSLRSGKFKALIECADDSQVLDSIKPEGVGAEMPGAILNAFRVLEPLMGTDASRPWSNGILLRGDSAYVTNNVIIAQLWIGCEMPEVNIPSLAVRELIRIREEPLAVTLGDRSITFHFDQDRWLRSQLLDLDWPDASRMLNMVSYTDLPPIPTNFFETIEQLQPFVDEEGRIYFREGKMSTSADGESGASFDFDSLPNHGSFHHAHLASLQGIATRVDFSTHPNPSPFIGDMVRGVIVGMHDL